MTSPGSAVEGAGLLPSEQGGRRWLCWQRKEVVMDLHGWQVDPEDAKLPKQNIFDLPLTLVCDCFTPRQKRLYQWLAGRDVAG